MIEKTLEKSMSHAVEHMLNQMMLLQRQHFLGVGPYERSDLRDGYANGFKPLTVKTGNGKLALEVPQVRDASAKFRPSVLEGLTRSEKAMRIAIAEMYIQGVSTRKVKSIIQKFWPEGISSTTVSNMTKELDQHLELFRSRPLTGAYKFVWLDAQYEKVRQNGSVQSFAMFVAMGLNEYGNREIIGVSGKISEAEIHWAEFLESLLARGLKGVELLIADNHSGLKAARKAVLPSVPWQRCLFHLQQNAQAMVVSVSQRKAIAIDIKGIFSQVNLNDAIRAAAEVAKKWEKRNKKFSEWVEDACAESFTYFKFKEEYWRKIRTSNPLERTNREIKRRTRVASIFPSEESCMRLVTAILIEAHENWSERSYIKIVNS
jgi:transposase-like protein